MTEYKNIKFYEKNNVMIPFEKPMNGVIKMLDFNKVTMQTKWHPKYILQKIISSKNFNLFITFNILKLSLLKMLEQLSRYSVGPSLYR